MDHPKSCFFCCKSIKCDFPNYGNYKNEHSPTHPINICDTTTPTKSELGKQSVLQIAKYLKVPRDKLDHLKPENQLSLISFCENCEEISETLSKLCRDVEITRMKIAHYLNLLTDRIIGINNDDDDDDPNQRINKETTQMSDLQKLVHKKCLLKVRKHENKAVPQLRLPKCQIPTPESPQAHSDNSEEDDYPIILEANENQIKIELAPDDNPELQSCPFCSFTVNCGDELHSHISDRHSEQFESNLTIHSNSDSLDNFPSYQVGLSQKCESKSKRCEICGLMVGASNLARHKKNHQRYRHSNDNSVDNSTPKFFSCDFCPMTFSKLSNKLRHSTAVHLSTKSKMDIKTCEICGAMVGKENIARHKRLQHQIYFTPLSTQEREEVSSQSVNIKGSADDKCPFTCDYCPLTFKGRWNRDVHMKCVHLQGSSKVGKNKRVTRCNICGALVPYKHLASHKKNRHKDVPNAVKVYKKKAKG